VIRLDNPFMSDEDRAIPEMYWVHVRSVHRPRHGETAMSNAITKPAFQPVPRKDGSGCYVRVSWPDGVQQEIQDLNTGAPPFVSEAEALDWIENDSSDWMVRHPRST
jgi:hypothetical protein